MDKDRLKLCDDVAAAAAALRAGELVVFPTETVYGLGADATNDRAVAAVFDVKRRPSFNPLICHFPGVAPAAALVEMSAMAERLAEHFWPGPLTMVLPRRPEAPVSMLASAGLPSLAIRVPEHPLAREFLTRCGRPVVAPSANLSGRVSPTAVDHIDEEIAAAVAAILDGGPCRVGLESTVVGFDAGKAVILRPGGITAEQIADVLSEAVAPLHAAGTETAIQSPGQLAAHYAPGLPLRMNADAARPGEVLIGYGPHAPPGPNLSARADMREAAANLFALLHQVDRPQYSGIAVMPVPAVGLGVAINDRLRRAAAGSTC